MRPPCSPWGPGLRRRHPAGCYRRRALRGPTGARVHRWPRQAPRPLGQRHRPSVRLLSLILSVRRRKDPAQPKGSLTPRSGRPRIPHWLQRSPQRPACRLVSPSSTLLQWTPRSLIRPALHHLRYYQTHRPNHPGHRLRTSPQGPEQAEPTPRRGGLRLPQRARHHRRPQPHLRWSAGMAQRRRRRPRGPPRPRWGLPPDRCPEPCHRLGSRRPQSCHHRGHHPRSRSNRRRYPSRHPSPPPHCPRHGPPPGRPRLLRRRHRPSQT